MSRIWNQHRAAFRRRAFTVARVYEGSNQHHSRHLAVRARSRLQRDARQARYLTKIFL